MTAKQRRKPARNITPIPGGMAEWYDRVQLSPRRQREIDVIGLQIMPRMRELRTARTVSINGEVVDTSDTFDGPPVGLNSAEARLLAELTDVAVWAYLKSWTLRRGGEPRPLPGSPDAVLDLEGPLYMALSKHAAKLLMETDDDGGFTVDALPDDPDAEVDPNLPT